MSQGMLGNNEALRRVLGGPLLELFIRMNGDHGERWESAINHLIRTGVSESGVSKTESACVDELQKLRNLIEFGLASEFILPILPVREIIASPSHWTFDLLQRQKDEDLKSGGELRVYVDQFYLDIEFKEPEKVSQRRFLSVELTKAAKLIDVLRSFRRPVEELYLGEKEVGGLCKQLQFTGYDWGEHLCLSEGEKLKEYHSCSDN